MKQVPYQVEILRDTLLRFIGYSNIAKALRDMMAKPHLTLRLIGI